jgi:hypothetical protein
MPFNVNPPCPNGIQTTITWQFPGQTQKSNTQGDDYRLSASIAANKSREIVDIVWSSAIEPFQAGFTCSNLIKNQWIAPNQSGLVITNFKSISSVNPDSLLIPNDYYFNGSFIRRPSYGIDFETYNTSTGTQFSSRHANVDPGSTNCCFVRGTLSNFAIIPRSFPTNFRYVIEILKNGAVVASDTGNSQPMVTYQCGATCPPNTCNVVCGNTICCYGADGISVLNFPNT